MNASELEHLWRKQQPVEPSRQDIAQIAATVCSVDRRFRRRIWWRDLREIGAALSLAAVCGFFGQTWLRWVSVASCLFVAAVIIRSRSHPRSTLEAPSVLERLHRMIRETDAQIQLLRSVLWWYLLPCGIGLFALVLDRLPPKFNPSHLMIFGSAMSALYFAIYWLNQRAVRKVLVPRRENLRHALAELSQPS